MGYKGPKATNIYQNPGIKNNPGIITDHSIKGVGSPAKLTDPTGAIGLVSKFGGVKEKEEEESPAKHIMEDKDRVYNHKHTEGKSGVKVIGAKPKSRSKHGF